MCDSASFEYWTANTEYCRYFSADQDQEWYDFLFQNLYQGLPSGIYVPGIGEFSMDKYNFQSILPDICNYGSNGKYCRQNLLDRCSIYRRSDMSNRTLRSICGCYLPDTEYSSDLPKPCDNICNSGRQVLFYDVESDLPQKCNANVCVIDSLTLNAQGSSVDSVTFSQACSGCINGCRCVINDVSLVANDSRIRSVDFESECTGGSVCRVRDSTGQLVETQCEDYFGDLQSQKDYYWTQVIIWAIFFLIFIILSVFFFLKVRDLPDNEPLNVKAEIPK